MNRDRHVRGVASSSALVGPCICTRRTSENPPLEGWEDLNRAATAALLRHPPATLPQYERAPIRERPARTHGAALGHARLRVQQFGQALPCSVSVLGASGEAVLGCSASCVGHSRAESRV